MKTVAAANIGGATTTTARSSKGETEPLLVGRIPGGGFNNVEKKGRAGTLTTKAMTMRLLVAAVVVVSGAAALTKTTRKDDARRTTRGVAVSSKARLGTMMSNDVEDNAKTFTLHTGCSPMEKVMPMVRKRFRTNENNTDDANDFDDDFDDFDDAQYDWSRKIGAKLVLKDDDDNAGGNDFSFEKGIPMEQTSCGEYRVTTRAMKRGTAFGFALYEMQITTGGNSSASEKNVASQLGRLLHYEKQRKEGEHFVGAAVKDIGCLTSDPKRVDTRCPWGERGDIVGGYSDAIAEDEHEHPFGMRECTFKYEYGDVTFYNRVFDGKQLEYVWGSCLESCPAFTTHPFCKAKSKAIEDTNDATTTTTTTTTTTRRRIEDTSNQTSTVKNTTSDKDDDENDDDDDFKCEKGHYIITTESNGQETKACGECAPGSFSFLPDDTSCQLCPKGFFQPFGKSNRCEACPRGMYQDKEGQKFCKPCDDGSEISPDDATALNMDEELRDERVPSGGISWKTNDDSSSLLGIAKHRKQRIISSNNRKLLGGGIFGKQHKQHGGWFSNDNDDVNGDGVVDVRDVMEREVEDAREKGKAAQSKDQCIASTVSPAVVVKDKDNTVATNDDTSTPIDVNVTKELTKDRVIPTPTIPAVKVVSDEAKEVTKEREPEATFESVQVSSAPNNDLHTVVSAVDTKDTVKQRDSNDGTEKIDPELIADEAAALKNSVRHQKKLNDLLREKEIDDDDTIVDKKIEKEEKIIETFDKVNGKEREKIEQTLASASASNENDNYKNSVSSSSCDETMRGTFGIGYRGCQTTTRTGKTCIDWSKQPFGSKYGVAHAKWSHASQPDAMDENPRNYCRNPSASADGIWCYVDAYGGFDACDPIL